MSTKPISQRAARALKRRVAELEQRDRELRNAFSRSYAGTWVACANVSDVTASALMTGARLGMVVVARINDNEVHYYAIPTEAKSNV